MKINLKDAAAFACASVYHYVEPLLTQANLVNRPNAEARSAALRRPGNHYGVLGYIASLVDNQRIIELGTRFGFSALALSINETNHIISYDIVEHGQSLMTKPNIEFKVCNLLNAEHSHLMLQSDIMFVDIAPHNGVDEKQIVDYLLDNNYKGVTLWHDIRDGSNSRPPTAMWKWWTELPLNLRKFDITAATLGTESAPGVGLVDFSNTVEVVR